MLVYSLTALGIGLSVFSLIFLEQIAVWLGAEGQVINDCVTYGSILLPVLPAFLLQNAFQAFFVTAEKPRLGLIMTITAGIANILLDLLLVVALRWGLSAAAATTAIGQIIGGFIPLLYFALPNKSLLQLTKPYYNGTAMLKTITNGSSEFVSNISLSIVGMLYNFQLLKYIGENGVAAYGFIMYVAFIFTGVFLGYSIGCLPIIGYHYGASNHRELQSLFRKSLVLVLCGGLLLTAMAEILALPLSKIFVGYDVELLNTTKHAFMLYSISFLVVGFNLFGSTFFTALNDGLVSAGIFFSRTMIFETGAVLVLPLLFGINGIWLSIVCAELMTLVITIYLFIRFRPKYHY